MPTVISIKCIFEGYGENEAVPQLLSRIVRERFPDVIVKCPHPIRQTRSKLIRAGELERCVTLASRQLILPGAIMILIDSDDDCPATLGREILERAKVAAAHRLVSVNLAHREFESWFLAAAPSFASRDGFPDKIDDVPNPEKIRGAKERVTKLMSGNRVYRETVDQTRLVKLFDPEMARRAPSFRRFNREVIRIVEKLVPQL